MVTLISCNGFATMLLCSLSLDILKIRKQWGPLTRYRYNMSSRGWCHKAENKPFSMLSSESHNYKLYWLRTLLIHLCFRNVFSSTISGAEICTVHSHYTRIFVTTSIVSNVTVTTCSFGSSTTDNRMASSMLMLANLLYSCAKFDSNCPK